MNSFKNIAIEKIEYFNNFYNLKKLFGNTLAGWQLPFISKVYPFREEARIIVKAPRSARKSTTMDMLITDYFIHKSNKFIIISSVSGDQSQEHLKVIKSLLQSAGLKKEVIDWEEAYNTREINAKNNSRILTIPQSEGKVGYHPDLLFIDELSRIDPHYYYTVLDSFSRGRSLVKIITSTPRGLFDAFSDIFLKGTSWYKQDVSIKDCPWIFSEKINEAEKTMPAQYFRQEVLGEFVENLYNVFKVEDINSCISYNSDYINPEGDRVAGIDFGRKRDYTAIVILDEDLNIILAQRIKGNWEGQIYKLYQYLINYSVSNACVEVNGVGDPVFEFLRNYLINKKFYIPLRPFQTTKQSKLNAINALIPLFEQNQIKIHRKDLDLINELKCFMYLDDKFMKCGSIGEHDDLVIALALANTIRTKRERDAQIEISYDFFGDKSGGNRIFSPFHKISFI